MNLGPPGPGQPQHQLGASPMKPPMMNQPPMMNAQPPAPFNNNNPTMPSNSMMMPQANPSNPPVSNMPPTNFAQQPPQNSMGNNNNNQFPPQTNGFQNGQNVQPMMNMPPQPSSFVNGPAQHEPSNPMNMPPVSKTPNLPPAPMSAAPMSSINPQARPFPPNMGLQPNQAHQGLPNQPTGFPSMPPSSSHPFPQAMQPPNMMSSPMPPPGMNQPAGMNQPRYPTAQPGMPPMNMYSGLPPQPQHPGMTPMGMNPLPPQVNSMFTESMK